MTNTQHEVQTADNTNKTVEQEQLPAAALRALAEARLRQVAAQQGKENAPPRELGGRGGQDPARYGDWEIKGRAIDF